MHTDISKYLYSVFYWDEADKHADLPPSSQMEIAAEAKVKTVMHTRKLYTSFDQSFLEQLEEAERERWYEYTGLETFYEFIDMILTHAEDTNPTGGYRYEIRNILKIVRTLEGMGVDKSLIFSMPTNISKARESTRIINPILESDASDEKKLAQAEEVLKDVADPNITFREFKDRGKVRLGKVDPKVRSPQPGWVYLLGGQELIVIESRSSGFTRAIESKLRGMVTELGISDVETLIKRISDKAFTKGKMVRYRLDEYSRELVRYSNGVHMPTNEEFNRLLLAEISKHKRYIDELLSENNKVEILVYEITGGLVESDAKEVVAGYLNAKPSPHILRIINSAAKKNYTIDKETMLLYPGNWYVNLMIDHNGVFGLFVDIER